jgi:hypothetical protein
MTIGRDMDEIITNDRGGSQSNIGVRYDLIPGSAIREIALILSAGAVKYGDDNWKLIPVRDHINHAINHLFLWLDGDRAENHLGNAACRCLFAVWAAKYSEG